MSEQESLELLWVTEADAGVYTLTVKAGSTSLHKEFIIRVLTTTTGWRTGERLCFFATISLFVWHSISAFPQGWINNLAEGPRD